MKRQFWAEAVLFSILILLPSCATKESGGWGEGLSLSGAGAAEFYRSVLEKEESPEVRWNLAYSYFEEGDYTAALECAGTGYEMYPSRIRFLYLKALALGGLGRTGEEMDVLMEAREKNPGDLELRHTLLSLFASEGKDEEAEKEAWDILRYDSSDSAAIAYLASSHPFFLSILPSQP